MGRLISKNEEYSAEARSGSYGSRMLFNPLSHLVNGRPDALSQYIVSSDSSSSSDEESMIDYYEDETVEDLEDNNLSQTTVVKEEKKSASTVKEEKDASTSSSSLLPAANNFRDLRPVVIKTETNPLHENIEKLCPAPNPEVESLMLKGGIKAKKGECQFCERSFTSLREHIESVHFKIMRFRCKLCKFETYNLRNIKNHVTRCKGPIIKKSKSKKIVLSDLIKRPKSEMQKMIFTCKCNEKFEGTVNLLAHQRRDH